MCTIPACFSTFYQPTLGENSQYFIYQFVDFLQITLIGEPMHLVPHQKWHYHQKGEVSSTLCCRLHSTHYTAIQIKNCLKKHLYNQSSHYKNTDDFHYTKEAITYNCQIDTSLSAKMNGTQRRTLVSSQWLRVWT